MTERIVEQDNKPMEVIANYTGDSVLYIIVGTGFEIVAVHYGKYKEKINNK